MTRENLEKVPELEFVYSVESELEKARFVLSPEKKAFYRENYKGVITPEGFPIEDDGVYDEKKLIAQIEREINQEEASAVAQELKDKVPKIIDSLDPVFQAINYQIPDKYIIVLTKYGPGGSYHLPNKVVITMTKTRRGHDEILAHELVHLAVEPLIQKNNTEHWVKERIVDLLMKKAFPNYELQRNPIESQKINQIFQDNYPNIEKILEEVSKINN